MQAKTSTIIGMGLKKLANKTRLNDRAKKKLYLQNTAAPLGFGAALGGTVGGSLGHVFGKRRGLGTALGALTGGTVGGISGLARGRGRAEKLEYDAYHHDDEEGSIKDTIDYLNNADYSGALSQAALRGGSGAYGGKLTGNLISGLTETAARRGMLGPKDEAKTFDFEEDNVVDLGENEFREHGPSKYLEALPPGKEKNSSALVPGLLGAAGFLGGRGIDEEEEGKSHKYKLLGTGLGVGAGIGLSKMPIDNPVITDNARITQQLAGASAVAGLGHKYDYETDSKLGRLLGAPVGAALGLANAKYQTDRMHDFQQRGGFRR